MRRTLLGGCAVVAALVLQAGTAHACGGLVAPNGAIRLQRATTLVDWHAGIEHYMTSFAFEGDVSTLGWIVPLPAVPTKIEEGGAWTLQRLNREVHPVAPLGLAVAQTLSDKAPAEVLQQVKVQALDITVVKGSGQAVVDWCTGNGFVLPPETRDHLLHYAKASPIFMAARYDVSAARARGLTGGDGTPLLITMPTPHPWVPLEILANDDGPVNADLFMLSDEPLRTGQEPFLFSSPEGRGLPGAEGFILQRQEQLSSSLHRDLSTDRNMGWVRPGSWLTYLTLDAPSDTVTYDLGVTSSGDIRLAGFGAPPAVASSSPDPRFAPSAPAWYALPAAGGSAVVAVVLAAIVLLNRRRSRIAQDLTGRLGGDASPADGMAADGLRAHRLLSRPARRRLRGPGGDHGRRHGPAGRS